ncbi:hypothetical protein VTO73DRAFT_10685 [Trametes versicolor]
MMHLLNETLSFRAPSSPRFPPKTAPLLPHTKVGSKSKSEPELPQVPSAELLELGFEFGPNRPAFWLPKDAVFRPVHRQHESLYGIASISSYAMVLKNGSQGPFPSAYANGLSHPPSMDDDISMSMSMNMSVDNPFLFIYCNKLRPRIDSDTGAQIGVFYDPMIAKLVVHGRDRTEALRMLRGALEEYRVVGDATNVEFLRTLTGNEAFKHFDELFPPIPEPSHEELVQAVLFIVLQDHPISGSPSPRSTLTSWWFGGDVYERTITMQPEDTSAPPLSVHVQSRPAASSTSQRTPRPAHTPSTVSPRTSRPQRPSELLPPSACGVRADDAPLPSWPPSWTVCTVHRIQRTSHQLVQLELR